MAQRLYQVFGTGTVSATLFTTPILRKGVITWASLAIGINADAADGTLLLSMGTGAVQTFTTVGVGQGDFLRFSWINQFNTGVGLNFGSYNISQYGLAVPVDISTIIACFALVTGTIVGFNAFGIFCVEES